MYEIIYAPIVQEKLAALKARLTELCGEKAGMNDKLSCWKVLFKVRIAKLMKMIWSSGQREVFP